MKKKVLAALLAVCMVASMLMPAAAATTFNDVDEDAWYASSIDRWAGYGILNGVGDNSFNPEGEMTRAQFAKMVVELLGLPVDEDAECPFEDLAGTNEEWAIPYIVAAYKAGIINGASATQFNPNSGNTVSFDMAAAMLSRALGLVEPGIYGEKVTEKLTELGLLDENVKADMTFDRAGVAALADNMIGVYVTVDNIDEVTEGGVITGEQTGVILVLPGARVEIKDATVSAVVAQGGEVILTGETTVDTVKVGGEYTTVTAEEGTTVGAVTVGGENTKVELNGTVESVVVAADAAEPEISGEGVTAEIVDNQSPVDVTVNGETVEGVPAEEPENPDEGDDETETPDETTGEGFVPEQTGPATVTAPELGEVSNDSLTADDDKVLCGTTEEDEDGNLVLVKGASAEHNWVSEVTLQPTHATTGTATYTCANCGAETTKTIEKLSTHTLTVLNEVEGTIGGTTYIISGYVCTAGEACPSAGDVITVGTGENAKTYKGVTITKTEKTDDGDGDGEDEHTHSWNTAAWGGKNADGHWHLCTADGCTAGVTAANPGDDAAKALNGFATHGTLTAIQKDAAQNAPTAAGHYETCATCGYVTTSVVAHTWATGGSTAGTKTCSKCGYAADCNSGVGHTEAGQCTYCGAEYSTGNP